MTPYEAPNEPSVSRPPYRPPIGVPARRDTRWAGVISLLLHALLVAIMIAPLLIVHDAEDATRGAGGAGPAGGGGGGSRGGARDPFVHEDLRYVRVTPPPPPPPPPVAKPPAIVPPVPKPIPPPQPVVTPPPAPVPPPTAEAPEPRPDSTPMTAAGTTPGAGNGAGMTTGPGAGPGTGGGTGTGTGPGRGSGVGPGNGGGEGTIFPPTAELMIIPELPVPGGLKGKTFVVHFEIDEQGRVARVDVATGNSGYDRKLRDRYMQTKWRPAHKADGTPVAAGIDVTILT
jgi:protein TonB